MGRLATSYTTNYTSHYSTSALLKRSVSMNEIEKEMEAIVCSRE